MPAMNGAGEYTGSAPPAEASRKVQIVEVMDGGEEEVVEEREERTEGLRREGEMDVVEADAAEEGRGIGPGRRGEVVRRRRSDVGMGGVVGGS